MLSGAGGRGLLSASAAAGWATSVCLGVPPAPLLRDFSSPPARPPWERLAPLLESRISRGIRNPEGGAAYLSPCGQAMAIVFPALPQVRCESFKQMCIAGGSVSDAPVQ